MSKTIHSLAKGIDVSIVTDAPQSAIDSPDRSEIDQLANVVRDMAMQGFSLVPWARLPDRDRAKWREGAYVAQRCVLDGADDTQLARDVYEAVSAGRGRPWHQRRDCERFHWLRMAPAARRCVEAQLAKPAPRPARTVTLQSSTTRPTLRERMAARKAG